MAATISPCLDHFCCAKGWPLSPLSPPHSWAAPAKSLEAAGSPVQRLLINASFSANKRAPFTFKYCIAPQQTRDAGWGEHWGPLWQSPVCVKFANNSPCEDSRAFSLRWGFVWRFSWENRPLSPPPVWCPLSLRDFSGILHSVRRYSLLIRWICWNVSGRTAELVFFAWRGMFCTAGDQPKRMAKYCTPMSRHEPGRRDLVAKRTLQPIKKEDKGEYHSETVKYTFSPEVSTSFYPFLGFLVACSAQSGIELLRRCILPSEDGCGSPNCRGSRFSSRLNAHSVTEVDIWGMFWWPGALPEGIMTRRRPWSSHRTHELR